MTKITTSSLVYSLSDYQKEDKKPIISDVMFHTMLNNEKRKKYVCYILSKLFNDSYEEIYNKIIFVNTSLDKLKYYESKKIVDLLVKVDDTYINIIK